MKLHPLIVSAILAMPFSLSHASATIAAKTIAVNFQKGVLEATYGGRIQGYQVHDYTFYAKQSQSLKAVITGDVIAYLYSPHLEASINLDKYSADLDEHGAFTLPHTGEYTIRVGQMRAMARRNKKTSYTLQIAIR